MMRVVDAAETLQRRRHLAGCSAPREVFWVERNGGSSVGHGPIAKRSLESSMATSGPDTNVRATSIATHVVQALREDHSLPA